MLWRLFFVYVESQIYCRILSCLESTYIDSDTFHRHRPGIQHRSGLLEPRQRLRHGRGVLGLVVEDGVPDLRLAGGAHAGDHVAHLRSMSLNVM